MPKGCACRIVTGGGSNPSPAPSLGYAASMRIYTRTGDKGSTGLYGSERRMKSDPRVNAYGSVDEANTWLGLARSSSQEPEVDEVLREVQNALFDVGADLATPLDARQREKIEPIVEQDVQWLEEVIDYFTEELDPLNSFVLPGGAETAAALHVARAVVRRAEREVVALAALEEINPHVATYLNRLSDLLFTLARIVNMRHGVSETRWRVQGRERSRRHFRRR